MDKMTNGLPKDTSLKVALTFIDIFNIYTYLISYGTYRYYMHSQSIFCAT